MKPLHKGIDILSVAIGATIVAISLVGSNAVATKGDAATLMQAHDNMKSKLGALPASDVSKLEAEMKAPPGLYFNTGTDSKNISKVSGSAMPEYVVTSQGSKATDLNAKDSEEDTPPPGLYFRPLEPDAPTESIETTTKKQLIAEDAVESEGVSVIIDDSGEPHAVFPDIEKELLAESKEQEMASSKPVELLPAHKVPVITPSMPPQWAQKKGFKVPSVEKMNPQTPAMPFQYIMPNGVPYGYMPRVMYVPVYSYRQPMPLMNGNRVLVPINSQPEQVSPRKKPAE